MVQKLTMLSVLDPFLTRPFSGLHLADISREIKQPHPTVRQHLNDLEKRGVLKKNIKGRLTIYSLNRGNPLINHYLSICENNKMIAASERHLILKEIVLFLSPNLSERNTALIFGSAVEDIKRANDIDLLVTGKSEIQKEIDIFAEKINRKIHLLNVPSLESVSPALKNEILKKHLIVQGTDVVLKWLIWKK
ncbi:MAG: helix-turn-helix domain-containing protein [archaeon]|nr:helix-turn-helix domain-containing protein [archaeon]